MAYEYKFDADACWYIGSCSKYKTKDCNAGCIRYMEMHYLMNHSGIPKNRQYPTTLFPETADLDAFMQLRDIKQTISEFVSAGYNLYIYSSNFGNGKTTWAIKLMQQFFNNTWPNNGFRTRGIFLHVPTFLMKVKEGISKKDEDFEVMRSNLMTVDLVIWDDIASTKLSDFDHALLLSYIDTRILSGLSNIYTGNIGPERLVDALGNRLASRVGNESEIIRFIGDDRRGAK